MTPILAQTPVLLIGEFPSEHDEGQGYPFVGSAGMELNSALVDAGFPLAKAKYPSDLRNIWLNQRHVSLTNVFHERPPKNDLNNWKVPRKEAGPGRHIPLTGGVIDPSRTAGAVARLTREIEIVQPNIIVALGNTALAAVCGVTGIAKLRGALHSSEGRKVLGTYHPAAVLRNYELRPAVVADLIKSRAESKSPEVRLLARRIHVAPTLADLGEWREILLRASHIAFDIETKWRQITCIGFAPSPLEAYVVPFFDGRGQSYWSEEEEVVAYSFVREVMESPAIKIAHNGIYDTQYLFKYDIAARNFTEDTMLLFHSLYPAMPKALGFLGSIYANERAWKAWRVRGSDTHSLKREE